MDKKILDIISNKYITDKIQIEYELEKLVNNKYPISVDDTVTRIRDHVSKLNHVMHDLQMWENILAQISPQTPPKEDGEISNK